MSMPHFIMVTKVVDPDVFLHERVIVIFRQPTHITPVQVPLFLTVRKRDNIKKSPKIQVTKMTNTHPLTGETFTSSSTHSLTSTQLGLLRRTS